MKKFVVDGVPARFGAGATFGLTDKQLATRAHAVEKLGDPSNGVTIVRSTQPLEFKIGEELLIEGDEVTHAITDPITGQKQSGGDRRRAATAKKKAVAQRPAPAKQRGR